MKKNPDELAERARAGERTALLVVVQRGDAERFSPADPPRENQLEIPDIKRYIYF